ncbi:MAG TPA: hypothetical protein VHC86_12815 [Opitutaceae bacterium]|nr:hypothetical protein [Opitutaceae bacterium]
MAAIRRRAEAQGVKVADLVYGALNCSMSHSREPYCTGRIKDATHGSRADLPPWSDSARSIGIYQGQPDIGEQRGPRPAD